MMRFVTFLILACGFWMCGEEVDRADAYGNFEAVVTTVSAEIGGRLLFLNVEEGIYIPENRLIGQVDTTTWHLQRLKLDAVLGTLPSKLKDTEAEKAVLNQQKENLQREQGRILRLLEKKAATPKQLDDIEGQIELVDRQIAALESAENLANQAVLSERSPLLAERRLIQDRLEKSAVYNPVSGTVLTKLVEPSEMVSPGMPLYRIASLDTMVLRFYVDATQLQGLKLGSIISVYIDEGTDTLKELSGRISWISNRAEFTPRTIQTKEERVHLVYAVKARVANSAGRIKIGMPAEVDLHLGSPEIN